MSVMLTNSDNLIHEPMTIETLKRTCPTAFLTEPSNPNVSDKYVQATTVDVINDMEKLGWYPVVAKQCRTKKNSNGIRSFHMIAFENENVKIKKGDDTEAYVRVILTNSHDGFNSFKFMCGIYRCICSNGLVVSDAQFANITIRHINYNFEELRVAVAKMLENIPNIVSTMNNMTKTILTEEQKKDFAVKAYKIRKGVDENENVNISDESINEILTPVRQEDNGNDLWTVFNLCQEKVIKGGFKMTNNKGKVRKQRPITSIKKDIDYNVRLWNVANSYLMAA